MSKIIEIINNLSNPMTGNSLAAEKRVVSVEEKAGKYHITYNRQDISPAEKKSLEKSMIDALSSEVNIDDIFIHPVSDNSDVYKALGKEDAATNKKAKPANLKVGHGGVGEKRSIEGVKNIIAVGSGKGGVGKSTFTSNLAITLKNLGHSVGVIDADIYGPSLPLIFNKRNMRPSAGEDEKIIPLESYGIKFISFGSFIHEDEPVVWRGPMLGGVLNQFFFETNWGELDYLLIDLPPGTGDVQLSMVQNLNMDGAIIISTPQDMALLDARKAMGMFDKMGLHIIGMVENMSSFICDDCGKEHFLYGTGGVKTACGELGVGYLGSIPMDIGLRKGSDFGKPYMQNSELFEDSKVWKSYEEIASRVDSYFHPTDNKKKSLLSKFLKN